MRAWVVGIAVGLTWVAGCSNAKRPVPISGSVKTASGKPVTGVRLILAPVGGPITSTFGFDLDGEGRFEGKMLPGTYTFYFATVSVERDDDDGRPVNVAEGKKLRASYQALKTIPAAYYTAKDAGSDRKVEVTSGATLTLTVGSATK